MNKNKAAINARETSDSIHNQAVKARVAEIKESDYSRNISFGERQKLQQKHFNLPLFPTTTIGSFPQTKDVRQARAKHKGSINR